MLLRYLDRVLYTLLDSERHPLRTAILLLPLWIGALFFPAMLGWAYLYVLEFIAGLIF